MSSRDPIWPPKAEELQRELDHFFDHLQLGRRVRVEFSECRWAPHVDVYEADGQAVVLVDLAGVPRDQIQVDVENDHLTLRGQRRLAHRGDERTFYTLEVPYGAFERVIHLPFPVDASSAEASYQDGFLEIVLPRVQPRQPRRVPVRTFEKP